jgi:hypothetical protein
VSIRSRSVVSWVAMALGACVLAACSSSGSKSPAGDTTSQATTQSAGTTPTTSGLTKSEFVSKADALCHTIVVKTDALPQPSGATDYAAIIATGEEALALFPPWLAKEQALVAQSSDKDELTAKWLAVEESDFNAQQPLLAQLVAAAKAKQTDKVGSIADQLNKAPTHSDSIAAYLTGYGLTECAKLESG